MGLLWQKFVYTRNLVIVQRRLFNKVRVRLMILSGSRPPASRLQLWGFFVWDLIIYLNEVFELGIYCCWVVSLHSNNPWGLEQHLNVPSLFSDLLVRVRLVMINISGLITEKYQDFIRRSRFELLKCQNNEGNIIEERRESEIEIRHSSQTNFLASSWD